LAAIAYFSLSGDKSISTMIVMNTAKMIAALDEELARLRQVRDLLAGDATEEPVKRKRGRPAKNAVKSLTPVAKKRNLSDEARQRIAEAQKRRWAAQKNDEQ
jgi:hypothetical protein